VVTVVIETYTIIFKLKLKFVIGMVGHLCKFALAYLGFSLWTIASWVVVV